MEPVRHAAWQGEAAGWEAIAPEPGLVGIVSVRNVVRRRFTRKGFPVITRTAPNAVLG